MVWLPGCINTGVAEALNRGLQETRGTPFVARMDADDLCAPDRLVRQVQFLEAHPHVAAVGSNVQVVGPEFELSSCK
jgi:glycosyltransferase involved in cell wall biosynthesis